LHDNNGSFFIGTICLKSLLPTTNNSGAYNNNSAKRQLAPTLEQLRAVKNISLLPPQQQQKQLVKSAANVVTTSQDIEQAYARVFCDSAHANEHGFELQACQSLKQFYAKLISAANRVGPFNIKQSTRAQVLSSFKGFLGITTYFGETQNDMGNESYDEEAEAETQTQDAMIDKRALQLALKYDSEFVGYEMVFNTQQHKQVKTKQFTFDCVGLDMGHAVIHKSGKVMRIVMASVTD